MVCRHIEDVHAVKVRASAKVQISWVPEVFKIPEEQVFELACDIPAGRRHPAPVVLGCCGRSHSRSRLAAPPALLPAAEIFPWRMLHGDLRTNPKKPRGEKDWAAEHLSNRPPVKPRTFVGPFNTFSRAVIYDLTD